MAADSSTVQSRVHDILDVLVARTFNAFVRDDVMNRNATAIFEAVREAALMIGSAIVTNPNHVHRNAFVSASPTSLTHGDELPDMAGPHDLIEIQLYSGGVWQTGIPRSPQQIDAYRLNPSSLYSSLAHTTQNSPLSGFYSIDNGRVKFTGNAARIYLPVISRSTIVTLIPDEYEGVWVALAAGLTPKKGDEVFPLVQHYLEYGQKCIPLIHQNSVVMPEMRSNARGDV